MDRKSLNTIFVLICFSPFLMFSQTSLKFDGSTFGDVTARQIGPAAMSGRISAIDAVDKNPATVYVGAASGGLWKSKNYGTTFKPVFDKYNPSIGAITIDQNHPDTIWVGTGEVWMRNSVSVGNGIYRTTNGGESWKKMGLENSERIAKIILHPKNPDVLFVAVPGNLWNPSPDRGLYKTGDGGKSWEKILYLDDNTGCSDVVIDPRNPDIILAGMWEFRRTGWSFSSGGQKDGLYRSTDGGRNWTRITKNLPEGTLGRISLAGSTIHPDVIYALIEAKNTGLYRSVDNGQSWKMMTESQAVNDRPFYFSMLYTDPCDSTVLYKPGFMLSKSTDGGMTFGSAAVEGGNYHSDCHVLYINRKDNNFLYMGTDGGVYCSMDKGNTWRFLPGLPVSQFYHVSADMADPFNVYGGLQDNGSWYAPSRSAGGISNADWKSVGFGDGFYVYCDKLDSNILYWQFQGGRIARYYKKTGEYKSLMPLKDDGTKDLRFNWNTPLIFSPAGNNFYTGAQYLYKTNNRGDSWRRISPDLTTDDQKKQKQENSGGLTADNSSAENHCTIYTINESPIDSLIIWAGTDDGNLQVTADGGKSWTNVVKNIAGLPPATWCSYAEPGRFDKNTVFVTFDGHRNGDKTPYVFTSSDLGKSWKSLSDTSLKTYCHIIKQDLLNPGLLFLGCENGLYISPSQGKNWAHFTGNMPEVPVMDLLIHPRDPSLVIATHGRGIMIIDDLTPVRQLSEKVMESGLSFLKTKDFIIRESIPGQGWNGDDQYSGQVPGEAAQIVYYQKSRHVFGEMYLEVYDKDSTMIQKLPAGTRKGINVVYWNIRMKPPKVPKSPQMEGSSMTGPNYPAGEYSVKLYKGNQVYTTKIRILLDPSSRHLVQDQEMRQEAVLKAYHTMEQLAYLDRVATDIRDAAKQRSGDLPKSLGKQLKNTELLMDSLHLKMVVVKEGKVVGEERLREKLGFLYGSMLSYKGKPTDTQLSGLADLSKEIDKISKEIADFNSNKLPELNLALAKAKKEGIRVISKEEFTKEP
ncbi:MAG: glycosyl hydrolase [Bacteroidetes bacterium]|nr:glycosyl hydrolase [Bacteroidota bacterium]